MSRKAVIRVWQVAVFATVVALWYVLTSPTLLPTINIQNNNQDAL